MFFYRIRIYLYIHIFRHQKKEEKLKSILQNLKVYYFDIDRYVMANI